MANDILYPVVDFSWTPVQIALSYTVGGNTYPPTHQVDNVSRASDDRYVAFTTPVNTLLTFVASVILPPGVAVVEYVWNFGDGSIGYGPTVTHTYKTPNSQTSATLNVIANNGTQVSRSKGLNLRAADRIIVSLEARVG